MSGPAAWNVLPVKRCAPELSVEGFPKN